MTSTQLLVPLLVVALTVVVAWLLVRGARPRAQTAGGVRGADDPLVAWVASLRHDGPSCNRGPGPERDLAWSKLDSALPRPRGQDRSEGPPTRRDSRRPVGAPHPVVADRRISSVSGARAVGARPTHAGGPLVTAPRRSLLVSGVLAAAVGALLGGQAAALVAGVYGTLGVRALLRRRAARHAEGLRRRHLDQLCDLAADLRAGLPVGQAAPLPAGGEPGSTLLRAAVRLADRTGAPLAELLDRIDADARAADRGLAAAAAQAAGARATAWLLAALPLGGIGLGFGIGVDPVAVLLHSTAGVACLLLAVVLQVAGLFWAERLTAIRGWDIG
ncbi:hypothetical protein [Salinispora arenicola]|uniref:hypothetical protein n=1 Tax=Salinispora arenicola TaxID=168697 RepID=UPI0016B39621|nr:hypothetical protein [Salinispora arenicola]NIL57798.1 hypothetical protein [Salinispora arenicola]NIL63185.1 hypothetical protein [Salinispora arenicola]